MEAAAHLSADLEKRGRGFATGVGARLSCFEPLHLRHRTWTSASVSPRCPRHSFASFAIAAGVSLFYLARIMGTSVAQIDATYGHLLPDSEDYLRGLLDAYDERTETENRGV
jgi:integrase